MAQKSNEKAKIRKNRRLPAAAVKHTDFHRSVYPENAALNLRFFDIYEYKAPVIHVLTMNVID